MRSELEELLTLVMALPHEDRRHIAQLLAESVGWYSVQDSSTPYSAENRPLAIDANAMKSVTVVLPDELAVKAQAAGLLAGKRLEDLIRGALIEQSATGSTVAAVVQRRRLIRRNGRLMAEALPGEPPVTNDQVRDALDKMEW